MSDNELMNDDKKDNNKLNELLERMGKSELINNELDNIYNLGEYKKYLETKNTIESMKKNLIILKENLNLAITNPLYNSILTNIKYIRMVKNDKNETILYETNLYELLLSEKENKEKIITDEIDKKIKENDTKLKSLYKRFNHITNIIKTINFINFLIYQFNYHLILIII